jgi:hypothetical protein
MSKDEDTQDDTNYEDQQHPYYLNVGYPKRIVSFGQLFVDLRSETIGDLTEGLLFEYLPRGPNLRDVHLNLLASEELRQTDIRPHILSALQPQLNQGDLLRTGVV